MTIYTDEEVTDLVAVGTPALTDLIAVRQSGDSKDKKETLTQALSLVSGAAFYDAYVLITDAKAAGAASGSFTTGSWLTHDLILEEIDSANIASLSSNQITLEAGTYYGSAFSMGYKVNRHINRLYDITGSAILLESNPQYSSAALGNNNALALIYGEFTISVQSVIELQDRCDTTQAANGRGTNAVDWGQNYDRFAGVQLWRRP